MARDKRYYKRFNFSSEPMEDYEVKDVMYRHHSASLVVLDAALQKDEERDNSYNNRTTYSFKAWIKNDGNKLCKEYKLSAYFFNFPIGMKCTYQPAEGKVLSMFICDFCFRISSPSKETIFPGEIIETGHYSFEIPNDEVDMLKNVYVKLTLQYEDGKKDELLTDARNGETLCIYEHEKIKDYILKDHPDFQIIECL